MSNTLAQECPIVPIEAGAALTQGQLVKISAGVLAACTAADRPIGVLLDDVESGALGSVAVAGPVVFLEAHDNAISIGDTVIPAAAGRVDGGSTAGKIVGTALEASTAQGHLIKVSLCQQLPIS